MPAEAPITANDQSVPHRDWQLATTRTDSDPMTTPTDLTSHWPLRGDPTRLMAAAAVLRAGDAEQIFGTRFPAEYVMASIARLLEGLASKLRDHVDLGHEVVSAATDIAEHVLAYVPRKGRAAGTDDGRAQTS